MNFRLSIIFIAILISVKKSNAQIYALYKVAPHCVFLNCEKDMIETGLNYYDIHDFTMPKIIRMGRVTGFSIDDNLKYDGDRMYLSFQLSYLVKPSGNHDMMTINLYFKNLPDTINYFLKINKIEPGKIKNVKIPSDKNALQNFRILPTGDFQKRSAYDITKLVFPEFKKTKEK